MNRVTGVAAEPPVPGTMNPLNAQRMRSEAAFACQTHPSASVSLRVVNVCQSTYRGSVSHLNVISNSWQRGTCYEVPSTSR